MITKKYSKMSVFQSRMNKNQGKKAKITRIFQDLKFRVKNLPHNQTFNRNLMYHNNNRK